MDRRGEKIGWIGGWMGGFIWVLAFGILWIVKGKMFLGLAGILIFFIALSSILVFTPWRHPKTKYWKLMIPMYALFVASIIFVLDAMGGFNNLAQIQYGLWIIPCLSPLFTIGRKTWK